ncbi:MULTISPECIES: hydrogenase 4 subunit B [unclassified Mesorhizobium]|uniref:hydrogenase 4 subunit B n=1 Tax=unclassified Mesorhizobium TaxID=325217 RepID=UPI000FD8916D|nr:MULTISPECIES: hydrogenase 4 subunit B [unclassified Mesorhizobium]TGR39641.1 hydrogenase 4 subunit B [bacterium M00.F.Ca.ET.199.01.1.1]TGU29076.1 hydrogenase 4 subunit B [bacterium M00.F.Ca.ET.156.01.1.1]TGV84504.1 hydrogenase 4 subunit B [Mesorhizobium sp. M00.F.Ca.ET.149.01.1.1]TIT69128.1 MAG: hydrogenase 4 subunit B [Mesorhizobium sp.]TGQ95965.1 hydrogenase 4 subunit B [Mesorhizobium sp. M8A.F.Ca.ET.208.01.1.1]
MSSAAVLLWGVAALLGTAVLAVSESRRSGSGTRLIYGLTLGISAAVLLVLASRIANDPVTPSTAALPLGLPWIGAHFRLDALSTFFLAVVNFGGAMASLYGLGYGRHESAPHRVLPFFPAFLAAMNLVVMADDAFTFLLSWEFMSLASWALVMAHHREQDNARAGYIYLVMASFGTLALLLAFGLLSGPGGNYTFEAMRAASPTPLATAFVLALMLLGAGSKAGLVPLHVWLPLAHPAAPSHVSALMSGVMTKVAVYGFIRVIFDLLGEPAWWSGVVVLFLGGLTAVLGILYALMEKDLKRLLAYSTIENVGVIFVSLGLALAFRANAMPSAAALALTAALFHVLNHSFFKSLLFFGAGAVLTATGERDMEKLGGLIHRMPLTSFAFLVGCVAISALPPFNGFVSEWLAFQAILQSPDLPQWGLKVMVPAVGGLLALSAALAAACFVKAFGITFLGRPRSAAVEPAHEVDRYSLTAMFSLAALCLLAGIVPGLVIDGLSSVTLPLIGSRMPVQMAQPWLSIVPIATSRSSYNGLLVFLFIAFSASAAAYVIHRFASHAIRRGPAWGCGFADVTPSSQYTAVSFAQPIRRVFGTFAFRARETVEMPPPGQTGPARLDVEMHDVIWETLYLPIGKALDFATDHLNHLQFLTIRRYLTLVFLFLVVLLLVLALWP